MKTIKQSLTTPVDTNKIVSTKSDANASSMSKDISQAADGEPKHTPTPSNIIQRFNSDGSVMYSEIPWRYGENMGNSFSIWSEDREFPIACSMDVGVEPDGGYTSMQVQEANAAFICRAVNCHENMLSLLKEILADQLDYRGNFFREDGALAFDIIERIEKLLAKAKGGADE